LSKETVSRSGQPRKGANLAKGKHGGRNGASTARPSASDPQALSAGAGMADSHALEAPIAHPFIAMPGDGETMLSMDGLPVARKAATADEMARETLARRRLGFKVMLALVSLLLLAEVAYLSPFTDPAVGQAPRVPSPVALAEVQPYGVNTFLHKEVDTWKKRQTFAMARDMGAGWIKQQFPWAEIEYRADPNNAFWDVKNNQNAWDKFDGIVDLAEEHGVRVIARIDSAPGWSHPDNPNPKAPPSKAHLEDFGAFITVFVNRYQGRVAAIQVWNEPNLRAEWGDKPANAREYVELLEIAYTSAKEADPNMIVLAAPLATNNETGDNLNETTYLQQMYDAEAGQYFDAMSANAYGKEFEPEDPPSKDRLNFRRVELLRAVMEENGDIDKSVWFNEYGWNASPADMSAEKLRWGRVTPEQQADYTVRGIKYARQHWPWAGVFTIWYLRQVGDIANTDSEYYFGLVNPDFVVSAAYNSVQATALSDERVAGPGEWGPLSSPVKEDTLWRVGLNPAVPGGAYVAPSKVGDTLQVPFVGTDVRVMLVPAAGPDVLTSTQAISARYYVSVDGKANDVAPELPRDAQGQAYIALTANGQATEVTLVRGLGAEWRTSSHTLQIKVGGEPPSEGRVQGIGGRTYSPLEQRVDLPGIGTVKIEAHRSYTMFALFTAGLLGAMAVLLWGLRQTQQNLLSLEAARRGR
jgi:hypothetical protein